MEAIEETGISQQTTAISRIGVIAAFFILRRYQNSGENGPEICETGWESFNLKFSGDSLVM